MSVRVGSCRKAGSSHAVRVGPCQEILACHAVRVMRVDILLRVMRVACHACRVSCVSQCLRVMHVACHVCFKILAVRFVCVSKSCVFVVRVCFCVSLLIGYLSKHRLAIAKAKASCDHEGGRGQPAEASAIQMLKFVRWNPPESCRNRRLLPTT